MNRSCKNCQTRKGNAYSTKRPLVAIQCYVYPWFIATRLAWKLISQIIDMQAKVVSSSLSWGGRSWQLAPSPDPLSTKQFTCSKTSAKWGIQKWNILIHLHKTYFLQRWSNEWLLHSNSNIQYKSCKPKRACNLALNYLRGTRADSLLSSRRSFHRVTIAYSYIHKDDDLENPQRL